VIGVTTAITVRLDDADHAALVKQASELGLRPGTLARILVHAGLGREVADQRDARARNAIDRLVRRSRERAPADAVSLVTQARAGLDPTR
jgi:hypothetical protein